MEEEKRVHIKSDLNGKVKIPIKSCPDDQRMNALRLLQRAHDLKLMEMVNDLMINRDN
jgi:hypothetical protein